MKLECSSAAFNSVVLHDIRRKNSNQKKIVNLAEFHLQYSFALQQQGSVHVHAACLNKKSIMVNFFIKQGADLNFCDALGQSAINFAILHFGGRVRSKSPHVCALVDKILAHCTSLSL